MSFSDFLKRRRKKKPRKQQRQSWFAPYKLRLWLALASLAAAGIGYIVCDLPDITKLDALKKTPGITVKAEDGTVLGTYGDIYGNYVPYARLPKYLINAVVATEDRNFFYHFGVDPFGLARAMYVNLRAHKLVQGGSTITQQVAKNIFLTPERTLKRKLEEMILALELEHRFTKQDILTIYLNRVYMGAGNYGVDAASRRYFGHPVSDITLSEAAILVGLLKAPSRYAPTTNPDLSEKRATQVLLNMVDAGYLKPEEAEIAKAQFSDEAANYRDTHGFGAFYFTDWVVGQLPELLPGRDTQDDLIVTTTLNPAWQRMGEDAVSDVLDKRGAPVKASQAALLALSPDGAIRVMVGGRSYRASQFNRTTQALRQPGSSFKLFVYLAALEGGYTPQSTMEDKPIDVGNWHPRDYSGKYLGMITLREALAQSINSIAVQLSEVVGRGRVIEMAQRLGITSELRPDPSIALGTNEVTLFDMTKAYAHLAAGGKSVYPYAIERVETASGQVLFERSGSGGGEVLKPAVVGMMNNMLLAVTTEGTGRGAQIGRPVAGKTGTTSDYRDAWFIGFVPQLVTGVWVGNDDTSPMKKVTGGSLPASIWHGFMMNALKQVAVVEIPNQAGSGTGGGFFPWLFQPSDAPTAAPAALTPKAMQRMPAGAVPSSSRPVWGGGAQPALRPEPEEEPTPEYNAPPSFWDRLTGDGDRQ